jgi:hypothetical protein
VEHQDALPVVNIDGQHWAQFRLRRSNSDVQFAEGSDLVIRRRVFEGVAGDDTERLLGKVLLRLGSSSISY